MPYPELLSASGETYVMPDPAKLEVEGGDTFPASPSSQYLYCAVLSVSVLVVFESEIPIDVAAVMQMLEDVFLPLNPRFSSIMVKDEHGILNWKRVKVKVEDHVNVPRFPPGLEFYDHHWQEYLSKIAADLLPHDRPLWDAHIITYPTRSAPGTMVLKLHHALGDGFSLMGAFFSCLRRADNPSLPPTFPSFQGRPREDRKWRVDKSVSRFFSMCYHTFHDFGWSLLKNKCLDDDKTPIRSGGAGVEFRPIILSSVTFPLGAIKQIKAKLQGTVNDVMAGIIFYGVHLYMQAAGQGTTKPSRMTALVTLNIRAIKIYQTVQEMAKPNSNAKWGNQSSFLFVPIPRCKDAENADPLDFVRKAKRTIKNKRSSLAIYLTGGLLELLRKLRGPEAAAQYIHDASKNTSLAISNLIGPMEQVQIAGHPIQGLYFMIAHVPQSLTITIFSYMGNLNVAIGAEKDFINSELFVSCMEKSFERMFEAAVGKRTNMGEASTL